MTTSTAFQELRVRLGNERAGYPILFEELGDHLLIVVRTPPRDRLRLCEESALSQDLQRLGLLDEGRCNEPEFDARYVIRGNPALLTPEVRACVTRLEPFVELDLTAREYRLLKELSPRDEAAVEAVLADLVELVGLTA